MKQRRPRPHKTKSRQPPAVRSLFRQPSGEFYRLPDLELRGGCVLTDGCRRVLDFTPNKLCLDMGESVITFYGDDLRIESLAGKRLVIEGRVARMEFSRKWEDGNGTV